jgi:catechol 2,3-dioxygenase-like lactoylglutathione lyase family enzyme
MKKIHVALAVKDFDESLREYTARLGAEPYCTVEGTYALWRTDQVNLSISVQPAYAGKLRHLGFEDSTAEAFFEETDANGFVWERFAVAHQREEIVKLWPNAKFRP